MKILYLDDNQFRHDMIERRHPGEVIHCYTVDEFIDVLADQEHERFDVVSLDHDLGDFDCKSLYKGQEATGLVACGLMVSREEYRVKLPEQILIHSSNAGGASSMRSFLEREGYTVRWIPFPVSEPPREEY